MSERPTWGQLGSSWAHYATGGRYGTPHTAEAEGGTPLTSARYDDVELADEVNASTLQPEHTAVIIDAPSKEEAEDRTAIMGAVVASTNMGIDIAAMVPGGFEAIEGMTRVERKKLFRAMVEEMIQSDDKNTKNMGLMFGLLSKDAMDVKLSDHVKDKLEAFAKGAGKLIAAAAAAVGVAIAVASKKIGELWDKTKPARDKMVSAIKSMVDTIARVTKPARDKAMAIAKAAGVAIKDAAYYVGGKAKDMGKTIGAAIANTALGKAISRATEKAGVKLRYGMMAMSAAAGAKLAAAGASMQEDQKKAEKASAKIQKLAMSRGDKFEALGRRVKANLAKAQAEAKVKEDAMTPEDRQARRDAAQAKLDAKKAGKGK